MKKKPKIMSVEIDVANLTAAAEILSDFLSPDPDYSMIAGVRAFIGGATGAVQGGSYVKLSLVTSKGDIIEPTHMNGWIFSTSVPADKRWVPMAIKIDGSKVTCKVETTAAATGDYSVIFEFLLDDELVEISSGKV